MFKSTDMWISHPRRYEYLTKVEPLERALNELKVSFSSSPCFFPSPLLSPSPLVPSSLLHVPADTITVNVSYEVVECILSRFLLCFFCSSFPSSS